MQPPHQFCHPGGKCYTFEQSILFLVIALTINVHKLQDICLRQEGCRPSRLDTVLTIVTYVGMIVSIISLVLTLIILLAYK